MWIGRAAVVTLPAEIDVSNADAVREDLLSVVNQGAVLLVADMSKTIFCDSAGVTALVRTFRRAAESGSGMRLVVSTPALERGLGITGGGRLIHSYPSVAASFAGPHDQKGQKGPTGQSPPGRAHPKA